MYQASLPEEGPPALPARGPIWVLGAGGTLGRAVCSYVKRQGAVLYTSGRDVDIASIDRLEHFLMQRPMVPTHVINCAGYKALDQAERDPSEANAVNAVGPANLAKLARKFGFRVVHISTGTLLGGFKERFLGEGALACPLNNYARSKLDGERALMSMLPSSTVVRSSWIFGGAGCYICKMLKDLFSLNALSVIDDHMSRPTAAPDLAHAIWRLKDSPGIWHFANSGVTSWFGIAQELLSLLKERGFAVSCDQIVPISGTQANLKVPRPSHAILDTARVEAHLGEIPRPWQTALSELIGPITSELEVCPVPLDMSLKEPLQ